MLLKLYCVACITRNRLREACITCSPIYNLRKTVIRFISFCWPTGEIKRKGSRQFYGHCSGLSWCCNAGVAEWYLIRLHCSKLSLNSFPSPVSQHWAKFSCTRENENVHLYLNSCTGHYSYFHKIVITYYKPVLSLAMLTKGEIKIQIQTQEKMGNKELNKISPAC